MTPEVQGRGGRRARRAKPHGKDGENEEQGSALTHPEGTAGSPSPCSTPQLTRVCLLGKSRSCANTPIRPR